MAVQQSNAVQKWEYTTLNAYNTLKGWKFDFRGKELPISELVDYLNQLGQEGWEIADVSETVMSGINGSDTTNKIFYFKRPIID